MRLKKVHIENYRSLLNIDIDFSECTVFVGKNNSGKSNVLKAIDFVIGEGYNRVSKNDFYNRDESLTIKIVLFFGSFTIEEKAEIKKNIPYGVKNEETYYSLEDVKRELDISGEIRIETEIFLGNTSKKLYIGDIYYKYLSTALKNAIVNSVYIPGVRAIDQMTVTYRNTILTKVLKLVYNSCSQTQKDELSDSIGAFSEKLKNIFEDCESRLDEISKEIINHDGLRVSIVPSDLDDLYKKLHIVLNDGIEAELDYKGTGIQNIIIIALFKLYSELRLGSALLLIEEPESFLHPHACRHIAKILKEIGESENIQLVITTHSPHNIINMNLTDIVLFSKKNNHTEKKQITSVLNETKLKKELNIDNLELFFSDKVVLVEGGTEKFIIPTIAKEFNSNFDFDKKDISVIEMGSKSNLDVFISLLNGFNIDWVALLDRDFAFKSESLGLMKKINTLFGYGFNIDSDSETDLITNFKTKGIYILQHGEIENYYSISWLYNILDSYIEDLSLSSSNEDFFKEQIGMITNTTDIASFKRRLFTSITLGDYEQDILNKIISIKHELLSLDIDQPKVGKILEKIFHGLALTKPRIAIRLCPYVNINDLDQPKKDDLQEFVEIIF